MTMKAILLQNLLHNLMFEMGYDDFEIETSIEETLDAKLNAPVKPLTVWVACGKRQSKAVLIAQEIKLSQQALNKLGFDAGKETVGLERKLQQQ